MLCASHLINRLPSVPLKGHIPFNVLSEYVSIPSLNTLPARVFGCVAYVHLYKNQRTKLDTRALKCVFVGYGSQQKGYKCYHPPSQKFYVTMDVTFSENSCYFLPPVTPRQGENSCYYEDLFTELDGRMVSDFSVSEKSGAILETQENSREILENRRKDGTGVVGGLDSPVRETIDQASSLPNGEARSLGSLNPGPTKNGGGDWRQLEAEEEHVWVHRRRLEFLVS